MSVNDTIQILPRISNLLGNASNTEGFPKYQISQWVEVASQFRLLAEADPAGAVVAWVGLNFLKRRLEAEELGLSAVQDLNWVLDSTIRRLRGRIGPEGFRSCLAPDELIAIGGRMAKYALIPHFDPSAIRQKVQRQVSELRSMSSDERVNGVVSKLDALFGASARGGKEATAARQALLYLADKGDAVSD